MTLPSPFARLSPYKYHIFLLVLIPTAFILDIHAQSILQQDVLGVGAWIILAACTRFSTPTERRQVWIMVGIATCVEIWSSIIWGIYRYRLGNLPWFVPPGHGLVYLFALRAARTPIMIRHGKTAIRMAMVCATGWALGGITLEPLLMGRLDLLGAIWWPVFVWFMRKPSAPVFAAAFFVTSYLELWGTHIGTWAWQVYAPVSNIPTGNPPSVISAGYCLMDFLSITVATALPATGVWSVLMSKLRLRTRPAPQLADVIVDS
jgi:hypothetical protein